MLPAKIRFSLLTALLLGACVVMSVGHLPSILSQVDAQEPAKPKDKASKLKELLQERLATIVEFEKQVSQRVKNNEGTLDELMEANRLAHEAALELCDSDKARVAVLESYLAKTKNTEAIGLRAAKTGQGRESTAIKAKAERLRVEIALERAKTKIAAKPVEGSASQDVRDQAALAEKQAAIKRAAVRVIEAQKAKSQAGVTTLKAQLTQAKAAKSLAETQFERLKRLFDARSIEEGVLNEQRSKLESTNARWLAAISQIEEAEGQVFIDQARIVQAELEFEEAELRMKQLKARIESK
jgi:hypothetical protein